MKGLGFRVLYNGSIKGLGFRALYKGALKGLGFRISDQSLRKQTTRVTWRFMGSYKWGYKAPLRWVIILVTLLITPRITTHEPPAWTRCNKVE